MLFIAFALLNVPMALHTKFVATYAAFMAGRSYQVYGNHEGLSRFSELTEEGDETPLLEDVPTLAAIRVAEDIFTCSLPWVSVPSDDVENVNEDELVGITRSCFEGHRNYESFNINEEIEFESFDRSGGGGATGELIESVESGFREGQIGGHLEERAPLRFAIMRLRYRNPMIIARGFFRDEDRFGPERWARVHVPILLNPGLESGVVEAPSGASEDDVIEEDDEN